MDHIDKFLATALGDANKYSPAICTALAIGKNYMNKYYNKTDDSKVYRISMGKNCTGFDISQLFYLFIVSSAPPIQT
jgi:hypothetical protein